jgi:hypothetical protein
MSWRILDSEGILLAAYGRRGGSLRGHAEPTINRRTRRITRRFPLRGAFAPLGPHIRCDLSVSASSADTCLRSSEARARLTRKAVCSLSR